MEHIVIARIDSDRPIDELVSEIQSNLEYENVQAETFAATGLLAQVIIEAMAERRA